LIDQSTIRVLKFCDTLVKNFRVTGTVSPVISIVKNPLIGRMQIMRSTNQINSKIRNQKSLLIIVN